MTMIFLSINSGLQSPQNCVKLLFIINWEFLNPSFESTLPTSKRIHYEALDPGYKNLAIILKNQVQVVTELK